MGYHVIGNEGDFEFVSDGATDFYTNLFSRVRIIGFDAEINTARHDISKPMETFEKNLTGLGSFRARLFGYMYATPRLGNFGLVTAASPAFYTDHCRSWSLTVEPVAIHDITERAATATNWVKKRPDSKVRWFGSYTCGLDSANAVRWNSSASNPINPAGITDDTSGTDLSLLTLTYGDSAVDELFSGEAMFLQYPISVRRGERSEAVFGFHGSAALQSAGTSNPFASSSTLADIPAPVWSGTDTAGMVARFHQKATSVYTYPDSANGGELFLSRITFAVSVDQPVAVEIELEGSGPFINAQ